MASTSAVDELDWSLLSEQTATRLRAACEEEWRAEQASGWVRAVHEASPEGADSLRMSESLEKVSASLDDEEARWRVGAAALQQHWQDEASSMMQRWRDEDSNRLRQALHDANSEAKEFERQVAACPPTSRPGWPRLRAAVQLDAVGVAGLVDLASRELVPAPSRWGAPGPPRGELTVDEAKLRSLLRSLHAGAFSDEALLSHVGLGGCFLMTTDRRIVYIRRDAASKGSWELLWHAKYDDIVSAEPSPSGHPEVLVRLAADPGEWESASSAPVRAVDCKTAAAVPLVLQTVRRAMTAGQEQIDMSPLDAAAAVAIGRPS